jgi:hypothetical protein
MEMPSKTLERIEEPTDNPNSSSLYVVWLDVPGGENPRTGRSDMKQAGPLAFYANEADAKAHCAHITATIERVAWMQPATAMVLESVVRQELPAYLKEITRAYK